jgi:16S rRNA (adenine1518-N6/adenine1519-N6)-dimethyltransferase
MQLLIDSANIQNNDIVLEVGCGTGSLTESLSKYASKVVAVEIDKTLAKIAERQLERKENVEIINADILENKHTINQLVAEAIESVRKRCKGIILLVANLPYNVACPVIMNLITGPMTADGMYVTIQKQVAERMTAVPGSKHYGVLSIFLSAAGDIKMIRVLKPTVFWPQPQVDSAMVSFVRSNEKVSRIKDMELFGEVVNLFMGHRRKMLQSCTKFAQGKLAGIGNWPEIFERYSLDLHNRPEQISPENYIAIANLCCEYLNRKA